MSIYIYIFPTLMFILPFFGLFEFLNYYCFFFFVFTVTNSHNPKSFQSHFRSLERLRNYNTSESRIQIVVVNPVKVVKTLCKEKTNFQNNLTLPPCIAKQWLHMAEGSCIQNCIKCLPCARHWSRNCGYGIEQNTKICPHRVYILEIIQHK